MTHFDATHVRKLGLDIICKLQRYQRTYDFFPVTGTIHS